MATFPAPLRLVAALLALQAALPGSASAQDEARPTPPTYTLEASVVYSLPSAHVGDTFQVTVAPPLGPVGGEGPLPVVIMTDADLAFGAVAQITRLMQLREELPPFLLVGVGYGDLGTALRKRARDLTPTMDPGRSACTAAPGCGGAGRFLAFLEEELVPFVATRHAVTGDRTYLGASLGGLFGAHLLLEGSDAFRRYVLGSPTVSFGEHAVFQEGGGSGGGAGDSAPPRADAVFVGVGGEEGAGVTGARRLVRVLEERGGGSGTVVLDVFEDERHMSVQPMVVARGLRVVFDAAPPGVGAGG